eukprot:7072131-Pyramimonas_sp.AAC.1
MSLSAVPAHRPLSPSRATTRQALQTLPCHSNHSGKATWSCATADGQNPAPFVRFLFSPPAPPI